MDRKSFVKIIFALLIIGLGMYAYKNNTNFIEHTILKKIRINNNWIQDDPGWGRKSKN